jgi:hypothetical protein
MPETAEERALVAKLRAHRKWAKTADWSAATAPAREAAALRSQAEHEVDPDGSLDPEERGRRAKHAYQAHVARIALRRVQARRRAGEARELADRLDQVAAAAEVELAAVEGREDTDGA